MNGKFGNFQQKQFDDDLQPTFDPFNVEDLLNLPLDDDDLIINQDFELNFDDHLDHTAVIHSNSCFDSSTFLNHLDNNNNNSYSLNSLFPPPGGSHLLDDPFHAPLPHLQWISDCMGEDYWSSENLNKLFGTTMSAPLKARPDECSETQYYPLKPAREGSECSETHYPLKPAQEGSECSETQYYPFKPFRDEPECSETQYDPLKPVRDEFECSETQYDPLKPVRHESISTTKRAARSKRPRASSGSWSSRPVPLSQGDSEPIQVTSPTKPVGSKKKGSGMGKGRPTIDSTQGGETRKCQHCETDKTPQWRTGPNGAKTLCNACGVRYKSGRLAAEYRPAASPTFVPSKHSNSHRKVLEIQRQNKATKLQQMQQQQQQQQFQHDHFNYHILNNSMIFQLSINDDPSINGDPSINDDYFINQHFGEDFRDPN